MNVHASSVSNPGLSIPYQKTRYDCAVGSSDSNASGSNVAVNIVSTIVSIAAGIFAVIAAFFLTVVLFPPLSVSVTFGISLLVGTGAGIGAFMGFKHILKQAASGGGQEPLPTPHRPTVTPNRPTVTPTPGARIQVTAARNKIDRNKAVLNKLSQFKNSLPKAEDLSPKFVSLFDEIKEDIERLSKDKKIDQKQDEFLSSCYSEALLCIPMFVKFMLKSVSDKSEEAENGITRLQAVGAAEKQWKEFYDAITNIYSKEMPEQAKNIKSTLANLSVETEKKKLEWQHPIVSDLLDKIIDKTGKSLESILAAWTDYNEQLLKILA